MSKNHVPIKQSISIIALVIYIYLYVRNINRITLRSSLKHQSYLLLTFIGTVIYITYLQMVHQLDSVKFNNYMSPSTLTRGLIVEEAEEVLLKLQKATFESWEVVQCWHINVDLSLSLEFYLERKILKRLILQHSPTS